MITVLLIWLVLGALVAPSMGRWIADQAAAQTFNEDIDDAVDLGNAWVLTPAGCAAAGGHRPDIDGRHCRCCGVAMEVR